MADEDGVGQGGGNLGDVLLRNDLVSESELEEAKAEAAKGGAGLTGALARLGYVKETQLVEFLSRQYGVPSINLEEVEVEEDVIEMIPQDVAERHGIIPIDKHGSTIVVAMTDPSNIYAMDDIKFLGFEQIFKNALTGLPLGAGKGTCYCNFLHCSNLLMHILCTVLLRWI